MQISLCITICNRFRAPVFYVLLECVIINLYFHRCTSSIRFLVLNRNMTLIKKSEQQILLKIKKMEDEEQNIQPNTKDVPVVNPEPKPTITQNQESNYISARDNPIVQSISNSGWQVSDIWRDIRVDYFSD